MISGRLTMRATVERNQASGTDGWGNPVAPVFQPLGVVRCFIWSKASREIVDGDKTAMIEDIRGLFALGTDITEADEISAVTDARGAVLIPGRLRVEGPIQHKHTHIEAALKRIA